ncbi:hypothetical protein MKX03_015561 [Papaver bracteatum]|nr:hypothetical protein MKX03_015561 [Papaver bracteatum]
MGWQVGFAVLMFLSALFFFLGKASTSLNRRLDLGLALQPINSDGVYNYSNDLQLVAPSNNIRFLNKACIIRVSTMVSATILFDWFSRGF